MILLRTPDNRFTDLPDYRYAPHYVEVPFGDARPRIHYVDEGDRDAPAVLMLHGEPSWSFLYRRVIDAVVAAGLRAIAPDLVGFGRSDKPSERVGYTYQRQVDAMAAFLAAIDLRGATLLCQDWGGLIGLRLVAEHGARFDRVVAANTFLPTGDERPSDAFFAWQQFSQQIPELPVGHIVSAGCATPLSAAIVAAYDAPFPDESFKAGARQFPMLVPSTPSDPASEANRAAWLELGRWEKPFLTAFGDGDPITKGADRALQSRIPGAKGQPHTTLHGAGHFLQEDRGTELGTLVAAFVKSTRSA